MSEFNKITHAGVIAYINSYIETMQDRISQGDPREILYRERILFFGKALELLSRTERWVPVAEGLPEVDKYGDVNVLVCMDDGFIASATYDKNNDWELWADAGNVTHWMPLPEPPKGDNNG